MVLIIGQNKMCAKFRTLPENDPHHIKITSCKIDPSSNGQIYLVLNYDFTPIYKDSFTDTDGKCKIVMPLTGHPHAQIEDFELLSIGNLKIKNGAASAPAPRYSEIFRQQVKHFQNFILQSTICEK